jgi:hypothetical protein
MKLMHKLFHRIPRGLITSSFCREPVACQVETDLGAIGSRVTRI